jgi:hypothetical protein
LVIFPSKAKVFDLIIKKVPDNAVFWGFCHGKKYLIRGDSLKVFLPRSEEQGVIEFSLLKTNPV